MCRKVTRHVISATSPGCVSPTVTIPHMASIQKLSNGRYRARYRDASGKEHLHRAKLKKDAQVWLDRETAKLETGTWVAPKDRQDDGRAVVRHLVGTYATRKASTVRMAKVHVAKIKDEFGSRRLDSVRPSEVKAWTVKLKEPDFADSYVNALHPAWPRCTPTRSMTGL